MCVSKMKRQPTERGEMFANHAAVLKPTENGHRTAIKGSSPISNQARDTDRSYSGEMPTASKLPSLFVQKRP